MGLEAEMLEVATEGDRHWASVRFSGMVREHASQAAQPFQEIWNLTKPADGSTGWLLAGIQQVN
jgi:predicted lipid-binding transport protein (Tim44 family)